MDGNKYIMWSLTFTKKVVLLVTLLWFLQLVYSAVMICLAIDMYGNFSYLDTFITDNGETFRLIVGANIVSKTVENVFKYNEGGIFGKSIKRGGQAQQDDIIDNEETDTNGVG